MRTRIATNIRSATVATLFFTAVIALRAGIITVTNTNDSGPGSLRQAILNAQNGDTRVFDLGGATTIGLTSNELFIDKSITISGPGANMLTVTRKSPTHFRIFHILRHTVTIEGLSISNGLALALGSSPDAGGGIFCDDEEDNNETLAVTVSNCVISGNIAGGPSGFGGGGGIDNAGSFVPAVLTISNSTVSSNTATFDGGGIYNDGTGGNVALRISNSTLSGNSADSGGAIYNTSSFGGTATLDIGNTILNSGPMGGTLFNIGGHSDVSWLQSQQRRRRRISHGSRRPDKYGSVAWPIAKQRRPDVHSCAVTRQPGH
jgi:hypothetical protein